VEINTIRLNHVNVITSIVENKQTFSDYPIRVDDVQLYLYDSSNIIKRREKISRVL
jgi:hypothetical protein